MKFLATLKSSASSEAQKVDPRYSAWILSRKANIIRKLAGTWATDKNYAVKLVRVMNEL